MALSKLNLRPPSWLRDLAGSWMFYTVLPRWPWPKPSFNRIARFAPIIGLLIGSLEALLWIWLAKLGWSHESLAFIVIAFEAWVTGGLHLDGLMDTADGIAAGKEKCHMAMKDSRVGASGVIALVINLSLQLSALINLHYLAPIALVLAKFIGRISPLWAIGRFNYLQKNQNQDLHHEHWNGINELRPTLVGIAIILATYKILNIELISMKLLLIGGTFGIIIAIIISNIIGKILGGHSGDSYGSSVVFSETFFLLFLCFIWKVI